MGGKTCLTEQGGPPCTISTRSQVGRKIFPPAVQVAALNEYLSDAEIDDICRSLGHRWRDRDLGPGVTVRSMVYRGLHPNHSIRATLLDLAAGDERAKRRPADASWCEARDRLPKALWPELIDASVARLDRLVGQVNKARRRGG